MAGRTGMEEQRKDKKEIEKAECHSWENRNNNKHYHYSLFLENFMIVLKLFNHF